MTTDKQAYHKTSPCPVCLELLHWSSERPRINFCPNCGHETSYYFDRCDVWLTTQSQRRNEKASVGKKILRCHEIQNPIEVKKDYWAVYDLGFRGKVYYCSTEAWYEFAENDNTLNRFACVGELIDYLNTHPSIGIGTAITDRPSHTTKHTDRVLRRFG